MRLPENPHMERKAILCLILCYLEDTMPLLHQRFRMEEIGLRELDEMRAGGAVGDDFEDGLPRVLRAWQGRVRRQFLWLRPRGAPCAYGPHLYAPTAVVEQ
jgi:hypothetical protein